ncbi:M57 family metalloprotease [Halococcus hamelinensis]|uniref:M57 family metalloprotease n=1 Tax=Halococcus hamelinensis TaxID=332168 RepID=UPI00029AAB38|nr:M57 family metalloprotease [Halococcus hamelinensis]
MSRAARVVVVVCLIASTGCVGFSGDSLPRPVAGFAGDPDNPYPSENLTVAVEANATDRDFVPLVREALDRWEANDERYLNYTVNATVVPNATDPDIRVSFTPALSTCGDVDHAAGCAPMITNPTQTADTVGVSALDNLSDDSTVHVVEHELGHAFGLGHDDEPQSVMAPRTTLRALPQPNATDRALAWDDPTLAVYLVNATPATREQIRHALAYYDRGADGTVPENVSFQRTRNLTEADVVVRFAPSSACGSRRGSCGSVFGTDSDGDGALERYERVDITLTDLETDVVGWHVARWLGLGFGIEDESAYPPALAVTTPNDQRAGEWWR